MMQDSLSSGLEELGVAAELDEHISEVQNNYGVCYIALGKPDLALPHFKRVLELTPTSTLSITSGAMPMPISKT